MDKKILLIDDDQTSTAIINSLLVKNDFKSVVAHDGEEGLSLAVEEKPDLIILDVEMPKMNGYTFINELKKYDQFKEMPIIVLTAHDNMEPIFKTKGITNYLIKPVDAAELIDKIKELLQ